MAAIAGSGSGGAADGGGGALGVAHRHDQPGGHDNLTTSSGPSTISSAIGASLPVLTSYTTWYQVGPPISTLVQPWDGSADTAVGGIRYEISVPRLILVTGEINLGGDVHDADPGHASGGPFQHYKEERGRIVVLRTKPLTNGTQTGPAAHSVDLRKTYGTGQAAVHALAGINVAFERGRFTAVMGPSGSGKSTLMHCMAGLDRPTSGQTFVGEEDIGSLDDAGLTQLRRDRIGFVFQSFNLVPTLTAAENITLPAALAGAKVDQAWFDYLVEQLGIGDRLRHRPSELSGGQQQRVACARALINRPDLIFADEPTGNLDSNASADLLAFLRQSVTELGQSIVMVTHDPRGAAYADRVIFLADGTVVSELEKPTADSVLERMRTLGA
jgi:putative ABC transport system ATP-binding protein